MVASTKARIFIYSGLIFVFTSVTAGVIIWVTTPHLPDEVTIKFPISLSEPSNTPIGSYSSSAISCDAENCAEIAKNLLWAGGTIADAAIGALLCIGAVHSFSSGIGGGFLLVFYNATTKETFVLNARETAPAAATEDMFEKHPENSTVGGLAVAIPGEVKGYWELHQSFGQLEWAKLFEPTIDLCRNGFNVTKSLAAALVSESEFIKNEPSLSEIYVNPETQDVWKEGDLLIQSALGNTLEKIAKNGADTFYNGEVANDLIADLNEMKGIITLEDLQNYKVNWSKPIELDVYGEYTLKSVPPPGSGALVGFMLRVLGGYLPIPNDIDEYTTFYQRIVETFKYAYAKRSRLGDPFDPEYSESINEVLDELGSESHANYIRSILLDSSTNQSHEYYGAQFKMKEDHGTSHLSIVGPNGDAISATSTINLYFGSKRRSRRTGIVLNNEMDDFSSTFNNSFGLPPSPPNFIKPGKRPMSSMSPTIFTDSSGKVRLVVGAAGGSRITTGTTLVSIHNLWSNMNIKQAIDEQRLHHQLHPMAILHEANFNATILNNLQGFGHVTENSTAKAVVSSVARTFDGTLQANYDFRKSGSIAGW